jgi:thiol-disulfide isomerase/thioredoxin
MKRVLFFTAGWCGPCKKVKPFFNVLMGEFPELAFSIIDHEFNEDLFEFYTIKALPCFLFLDEKSEVSRISGVNEKLIKELTEALNAIPTMEQRQEMNLEGIED